MTPSLLPFCVPRRWNFSFGNRQTSKGAISGEYGGWGRIFKSTFSRSSHGYLCHSYKPWLGLKLSLAKMWFAYLGMTPMFMCSSTLAMQGTDRALGWISTWHQCHLCWSWSETLAAAMYACYKWLWYNFLSLGQRKCHCTESYGILKLPMFSYQRWHLYHSYRVDECSNAFLCLIIVSHQ